jgi:hypothetical protein
LVNGRELITAVKSFTIWGMGVPPFGRISAKISIKNDATTFSITALGKVTFSITVLSIGIS